MSGLPHTHSQETESSVEVHWPKPEVAVVTLSGEHDLGNVPALRETLDEALLTCSHLIVDISPATFIDSSTVNALVRTKKDADEGGCRFNLVLGMSAMIERTLEICGVLPALNPIRAVDQAFSEQGSPASKLSSSTTSVALAD
jgi:anti-anti-sigma factor